MCTVVGCLGKKGLLLEMHPKEKVNSRATLLALRVGRSAYFIAWIRPGCKQGPK